MAVAATAHAQPAAGNLPIDTFRPAIDSRGYLTLNASQPLGHKEVSFGLGALSWGHRLLDFEGGGASYSVDNVVTATLIAAFGVKAGPAELELGVSLPLAIMSGDRGPDNLGSAGDPNDDQLYKLDGQGMGNLGIHLKTRFLKTSRKPHIGLGVIASLYLPTATQDRFLGEKGLTPQLMAIVDKEFGRTFRITLNGGIRLRSSTTFTDMGEGGATPTNGTISAGAELPVGFGFAYAIAPQKFEVVGEVIGSVPLGDHQDYQPAEALAGVKLYLAHNSFLSLGAGRGLMPAKGGSPDARAFIGIVFEPSVGDKDGDGLKDDIDKCPLIPEDFDDFEDEDGCPEPDNDHDRILDEDDKCPNIPENRDGFQDEDGCPDHQTNDRDGDKIVDDLDKCPDDPEDYDGFQDEDGCPDLDNDQDKILDVDDLCPDVPEDYDQFEDEDGCPDLDNDQDKILDVDDLCPDVPEDYDQFEDEDGCPDLDNDKDRIVDKLDKCPMEPENYNNVDDTDGCPDRGITELTGSGIITLEPIQFEFNKAIIKKESYPILDAVIATMNGNPDISLIEVQGHTDERGDDLYNLELSDRRAAAVVQYLTTHGTIAEPNKPVPANRLTSQGYGETQPVDPRHNEQAWAKNRRVAFVILKRATD